MICIGASWQEKPEPATWAVRLSELRVVPRQLPGAVPHFVGRADELKALADLLEQPGTAATAVISGMAGVGKTALAIHWAHQVAGRFTDGQLNVNLCGYDPGRPMSPTDALAGFLRSLGVPGHEIPAEEAERASRCRSLMADWRMLVILDNAPSAEKVRPLLPGTHACVVVVTSRDSLAGLVACDGAARLDLDLLPGADAVSLLGALLGRHADAEPEVIRVLADRCCRLPLALRVAAELAAARPPAPLANLVSELADQQRRLDLLDASGDPRTAVRAVFSRSYQYLDAEAARALRLGIVGLRLGRYQHAAGYLQQAIALFHGLNNTNGKAEALRLLGEVHLVLGRYEHAADNFEQAITTGREAGDRALEAWCR